MPGIDPQKDIVDASGGRVKLADNLKVMPTALLNEGAMELTL
jgi:acyl CoA:acetate/3-ketoacid CoA transferase